MQKNGQARMEDIHAFLEKTLIEAYLKGKGYTQDDLQDLPEEKACQTNSVSFLKFIVPHFLGYCWN